MIPPPLPLPAPRRRIHPIRVGLLLLVAACGIPGEARGQTAARLAEREAEYESARLEFQAAEGAYRASRIRFDQVVAQREAARGEERSRILARANELSQELQNADRRVRITGDRLNTARQQYVDALDERLEHLVGTELTGARSPGEREGILALVADLELRLREAEDSPPVDEVRIRSLSVQVYYDPRDTPDQLILKARQLELQGEQLDSLVVEIDERIRVLESRLRRDEAIRDFSAGIDRFGAARLPVGVPSPRTTQTPETQEAEADSAGAVRRARTPQEEITELREFRTSALGLREQALAQARVFRDLARGREGAQ